MFDTFTIPIGKRPHHVVSIFDKDEALRGSIEDLATNLEENIFTQFKQTNPKYKNQVGPIALWEGAFE